MIFIIKRDLVFAYSILCGVGGFFWLPLLLPFDKLLPLPLLLPFLNIILSTLIFWRISIYYGKTQAFFEDQQLIIHHYRQRYQVPIAQVIDITVNHYQSKSLHIACWIQGEKKIFDLKPDMDELEQNKLSQDFEKLKI